MRLALLLVFVVNAHAQLFDCAQRSDGIYGEECGASVTVCLSGGAHASACPAGQLYRAACGCCTAVESPAACAAGKWKAAPIATSGTSSCDATDRNMRVGVGACSPHYTLCVEGVAHGLACPAQQLYDATTDECTNAPTDCLPIADWRAGSDEARQQEDPVEICASANAERFYALGGCSDRFVACAAGRAIVMACPAHLVYDEPQQRCDGPHNVAGCSGRLMEVFGASVFEGSGEQSPEAVCGSVQREGFYALGGCTDRFVACTGGRALVMACPARLVYDDLMERCEYRSDVVGCGDLLEEGSGIDGSGESWTAEEVSGACRYRADGFYGLAACKGHFLHCHNRVAYRMFCPMTLKYNQEKQVCAWPRDVPGCLEESGENDGSGLLEGSGDVDGSGLPNGSGEVDGSGLLEGSGEEDGSGLLNGSGEIDGSGLIDGSGEEDGSGLLNGSGEVDGSGLIEGSGEEDGSGLLNGSGEIDDSGFLEGSGSGALEGSGNVDGSGLLNGSGEIDGSSLLEGSGEEGGSELLNGSGEIDESGTIEGSGDGEGAVQPISSHSLAACVDRRDGLYAVGCAAEVVACKNGLIAATLACPAGLVFDDRKKVCDGWPNVAACEAQSASIVAEQLLLPPAAAGKPEPEDDSRKEQQGATVAPATTTTAPRPHPNGQNGTDPGSMRQHPLRSVLCKAADGFFAVDCSTTFISCTAGVPTTVQCGEAQAFDDRRRSCVPLSRHPMCFKHAITTHDVLDDDVDMVKDNDDMADLEQPVDHTFECAQEGRHAHHDCADSFVLCEAGRGIEMFCVQGFLFDESSTKCVPARTLPRCQAQ